MARIDDPIGKLARMVAPGAPMRVAELVPAAREVVFCCRALQEELARLRGVLQRIDGGDSPCTDEAKLREWAYEALTLGRGAEELSE